MAVKVNLSVTVFGAALFCAGVAVIYWPLAMIIAGAALVAAGLLLDLRKLAA